MEEDEETIMVVNRIEAGKQGDVGELEGESSGRVRKQ
jgi:hypothetical protein